MQLSGPGTGAGAARLSRPRGPWVGERRAARTDLGQRQVAAERPCSRGDRAALGGRQGDKVKKGQVLGYIEQLGTFMPVSVRARQRPAALGPCAPCCRAAGRALSARCACADRARTHQRPVEVGKQRTAGMHVRVFDAESLCLTHIRTCHDECSGQSCSPFFHTVKRLSASQMRSCGIHTLATEAGSGLGRRRRWRARLSPTWSTRATRSSTGRSSSRWRPTLARSPPSSWPYLPRGKGAEREQPVW